MAGIGCTKTLKRRLDFGELSPRQKSSYKVESKDNVRKKIQKQLVPVEASRGRMIVDKAIKALKVSTTDNAGSILTKVTPKLRADSTGERITLLDR